MRKNAQGSLVMFWSPPVSEKHISVCSLSPNRERLTQLTFLPNDIQQFDSVVSED